MMRPLLALALLGCGKGGNGAEEVCVPDLPAECDALYAPTFDNVHAQTIATSCAVGGCHDAEAPAGGLDLDDPDVAYANLVDDGLVLPGDAACSLLMLRLEGYRTDVMPPGSPLPDAELCAIQQWIDAGAER